MDMRYHMTDPAGLDPKAFEKKVMAELKLPSQLVMRHRTPHFGHIFSNAFGFSPAGSVMW
jgi:peptidyl-dipeptidase Dcp